MAVIPSNWSLQLSSCNGVAKASWSGYAIAEGTEGNPPNYKREVRSQVGVANLDIANSRADSPMFRIIGSHG